MVFSLPSKEINTYSVIPYCVHRRSSRSRFTFIADHAGKTILPDLNNLGVENLMDLNRHIAWDIGIGSVGRHISAMLDSSFIEQTYSRLIVDCNRAEGHVSSILSISDGILIPANQKLSKKAIEDRYKVIFRPYHKMISHLIDEKIQMGISPILVSLHSFTPVMNNISRPWHIGILHNRDHRLARKMIRLLENVPGIVVGDNRPYVMTGTSDFTVPHHAEKRHIPCVEIEIRQDLIDNEKGQYDWATLLSGCLPKAVQDALL